MLSAGIVGLPNVGKSTLFNAVTRTHKAPAENYPFCTIDPIRDIEIINTELVLADLAALQKKHDRLQKEVRAGDKTAKNENAIVEKLLPHLDAGKPVITASLTPEEKATARNLFLLTSKPTIFACNVAESDLATVATGAHHDDGATDLSAGEITVPGHSAAKYVAAV